MNELVSIIIPTKNSAKYLGDVFLSIKNQTYQNIEILLIDFNSSDKTLEIAKKFTKNIYSINGEGDQRSRQKNFGAKKSSGKYILCLDSDAELMENVIAECVKLGEKGFDMVIIPERHKGSGFWSKAKALERECYLGDDTIECPWFFNKESFFSVGGYKEKMIAGEDWDIFNRLKNKKFRYTRNESFINHNLGKLKFFNYIDKKRYYGKNITEFVKNNKRSSAKKIPFLRLAFLRNWRLLLKHPFLTGGFVLLKFGEVFGMIIGIIESKIQKNKKNFYDVR